MVDEYIRKQDAVNVVANTAKMVASFNYQYAIDALLALTPADVVEVKHGEWISECEPHYECSECHHWFHLYQYMNYCHNCGVKMDGKKRK